MVSYYNPMYQKSTNFSYAPNPHWYAANYHATGGTPQFLAVNGDSSPQQMYYPGVFQPSPDWPTAHEGFPAAGQSSYLQNSINLMGSHHHQNHSVPLDTTSNHGNSIIQSIPTPPMTLVSSDIPTPASSAPTSSTTPPTPAKPAQSKSPFEWMKKTSYQSQPHPGKTRTKDKYRVVYSDHQRLELEKEFHYTRYITIRRKSELAQSLQLSERQVKIWFQNRRAKDRKQKKKTDGGSAGSNHQQSTLNSSGSGASKYINVDGKMNPINPYLEHHLHHSMGLSLHHPNHPALHHSHNHPSPIDSTGHVQTVSSGPLSMN